MKAITLTQPWATLVAIGAKHLETRSWRTNYRGPIAIHAAKDKSKLQPTTAGEPFSSALRNAGIFADWRLPLGAVVATARLVECIPTEDAAYLFETRPWWPYPEFLFGDYSEGRWAWLLVDVKQVDPLPARGSLGLWDWDAPREFLFAHDLVKGRVR